MSTPLRRSTRLKTTDTPGSAVQETIPTSTAKKGPRYMAKLKKEREQQQKLEAENILNKTAPAPRTSNVSDNADSSVRRSRRRSMVIQLTEDIKPIEVVTEIKSEIVQNPTEQPKKNSFNEKKSLSKESSNDEGSIGSSIVSSTASEQTTIIENSVIASESIIKTEPSSFKQEIDDEEKLDDISLIDLSEETPAKTTSFADIVKNGSIENVELLENLEAPNEIFDATVAETTKVDEEKKDEPIEVPKTPSPSKRENLNETFSPVVDTQGSSANDSRPHIEMPSITVDPATSVKKPISNRTSTPFASKSGVNKSLLLAKDSVEDSENDSVFIRNPLEKSILKGSRRKRSMSCGVFETEVSNRKVMFVSPKVMDIDKIDERMMASFISEKEMEMSTKKIRKRSLSVGSKSTERQSRTRKMPDFKAIHENNFNKMESLDQHMKRKADRAKRLLTPDSKKPEVKESKIPKMTTTSTAATSTTNERPKFTFSSTAMPPKLQAPKTPTALKPKNFISNIQKPKVHVDVKPFMPIIKTEPSSQVAIPTKVSTAVANRIKVEERRERNMSLYKTNHVQRATNDVRQKNMSILKGVRLNRRFELQMQQRQKKES